MFDLLESLIEHHGAKPVPRCGHWLRLAKRQGLVTETGAGRIVVTDTGRAWLTTQTHLQLV